MQTEEQPVVSLEMTPAMLAIRDKRERERQMVENAPDDGADGPNVCIACI